jgi:hypothetical protein
MNNWNGKKKVLALLAGMFVVVGLIVTVFLVQKVQEIRSRAEKATTISLAPSTQEVSPGEDATLDIVLNPGVNQVSFVKLYIKYDSSAFIDKDNLFELDPASGMRLVEQPTMATPGEVVITLDLGSDPTKAIRSTQRLGTLNIQAMGDAKSGVKNVTIDSSQTQVRSIQSTDAFKENVLANVSNATITISGGVCVPNVATCSWDVSENATAYHYKVTDLGDNSIVEEGDVDSNTTQIDFPSEAGKTYKCEVIAKNECAQSSPSEGQSTCEVPSSTPTPKNTSTPTPKPSSTPTPKNTSTPTPKHPYQSEYPALNTKDNRSKESTNQDTYLQYRLILWIKSKFFLSILFRIHQIYLTI